LPSSTQLFAAPEPVRVPAFSTRATISFDKGRVTSVSALHSQKTLRAGNVYEVVSAVSRADPDSLRASSQNYPEWVERRYLQLPDTVTDRTRALAAELVVERDNPYDQATAIETYLRTVLEYDLAVPAPPEGQDFVDFVLFDLESGYCDYYASSFVVLARSVGLPARIAMGYAQGEYDEEVEAYRVRANNGHSWPEVFFSGYGWIQFEPTVVIDPIDRPDPPADSNASGSAGAGTRGRTEMPLDEEGRFADEFDMAPGSAPYYPELESRGPSPLFFALVGLLVIAGIGTGAVFWATEKRGMSGLSFIERAYTRMWRFAAWLGVPAPPDQTPYERANVLKELVPEGEPRIARITDMYVVERFGRGNGNGDGKAVEEEWKLLRPALWRSWFQKKFSRLQREDRRRWQDFHRNYQSRPRDGQGQSPDR